MIAGNVKDWDALRQKRRVVKTGLHRDFCQTKGNDRRRMAVHDGADIGAGFVNLAMDKAFKKAFWRGRITGLTFKVVFDDIAGRHKGRGKGTGMRLWRGKGSSLDLAFGSFSLAQPPRKKRQ